MEFGKSYFKSKGEKVIDISITPNRPDCLGVRGIARDLAASGLGNLLNNPLNNQLKFQFQKKKNKSA